VTAGYAAAILPDADELRRALQSAAEEHYGHPVEIDGPRPLLGGASRELWAFDALVEAERHPLVLRRDPPGVEDPAARAREAQALAAAGRHGVPVPALLWVHDDGGMVMQRLEGETIARRILREERFATARARLVGEVARAAAAAHAVPLDEVALLAEAAPEGALPGSAPSAPPAEPAVAALGEQLGRMGEPHPALELGVRWLRAHLPEPVEPALVHGDLRLSNVMVDEAGLVGALDWELCHLGDPAEDLGWMCIRSWRFGNDDLPALGCGTRDELLEAYAAAGGREVTRDELRFWEAFGNVRWGIICVVQADIHLSGARRSLEHAAIGRRTCEPEWDLLAMID
jgi:aminoglycoside phosphotransferase (APT) family kinase protein